MMSPPYRTVTGCGATLATEVENGMTSHRRQYLTDARGMRTAVVLPIAEYERMLEDLHDLRVVAERQDEPVLTLDELKRRLAEGDAV